MSFSSPFSFPKSTTKKKRARDEEEEKEEEENQHEFDDDEKDSTNQHHHHTETRRNGGGKKTKPSISSSSATALEIPGGYFLSTQALSAPKSLSWKIRKYLDHVIGTALLATEHRDPDPKLQFLDTLVLLIKEILLYNGIRFNEISLQKSNSIPLVEILWFSINVHSGTLRLYLFEDMFEEFLETTLSVPVVYASGHLSIEEFNPFRTFPQFASRELNAGIVNAIVLADHVSQHIIHYMNSPNCQPPLSSDIHENWTASGGTTLHSMFLLTQEKTKTCKSTSIFNVLNQANIPSEQLSSFLNL